MSDTTKLPGTAATTSRGTGFVWNDINNIKTNDSNYAYSVINSLGDGWVVLADGYLMANASDSESQTFGQIGVSYLDVPIDLTVSSFSVSVYETPTVSQINSSDFGIRFWFQETNFYDESDEVVAKNFGFNIPSGAEITGISWSIKWQMENDLDWYLKIFYVEMTVSYALSGLVCESTSFSLVTTNSFLKLGRVISALSQSYLFSGINIVLRRTRIMVAASILYTISLFDSLLLLRKKFITSVTSFSVSTVNINFLITTIRDSGRLLIKSIKNIIPILNIKKNENKKNVSVRHYTLVIKNSSSKLNVKSIKNKLNIKL